MTSKEGALSIMTLVLSNKVITQGVSVNKVCKWVRVGRKAILLLMEITFFPRIVRKAFQGPMHGRLWCGKIHLGS